MEGPTHRVSSMRELTASFLLFRPPFLLIRHVNLRTFPCRCMESLRVASSPATAHIDAEKLVCGRRRPVRTGAEGRRGRP